MPGEANLSSRFDYLFEPLDDDASADDAIDADPPAGDADDETRSQSAAPIRLAFAAFVFTSLVGVAVVAALLLQRPPAPADPVNTPLEPAQLSTTVPNGPAHRVRFRRPIRPSQRYPAMRRKILTRYLNPSRSPSRRRQPGHRMQAPIRRPLDRRSVLRPKRVRLSPTKGHIKADPTRGI